MECHVSLEKLTEFAKQFWKHTKNTKVLAFHGEMGSGKTTIISALAQYKGTKDVTASPTFSIINEYSFIEKGEEKKIYHIDLYRLKDEEEVIQAGVEDCMYSGSICMIEWPEKAPHLFDEKTLHVFIQPLSKTERRIEIRMPSSF